ncbi:MAG: bifunctional phosphopantothenoylcysteine decarboxylase/phosphopantothenate--cysteine ligase CoaBC [cyanobacterium endosymbiont of Rhopalodia musculus]|uniref:bifunctional phosphopantothenoylcysteine decarboxylase/phosphopantothenate--cysteine ligase CoaBC n=1 Tax=cyanobacterium endosymbiont of Epithemia clementina EcSB TaxID=3034674 RepID=UPI00247FB291|nr:bifunctional phosphopantothenoylcysteine decarboxylase/phosphopantothenate--cysteine ligase CoaBC [cyanobacterium endosymbiont of Epithemia clementina EcSB]WGT66782.1 bifunctional phosphopantothenoylcysteine decarboxylase/phosphopantothenate--cysteine ligase CoaBC [cyanobacterium endosymbiont of Epithemia clementina EcSB]
MKDWDFSLPPSSDLGDHDVPLVGNNLLGQNIALLITGGIAAMKTPLIARALRREGANVLAFVSKEATRYVTLDALEWSTNNPIVTQLTSVAEHLSDRASFSAYLVAPATYNTINKMRYGIADGVITSTLASALGRMEQGKTKIMIVPTMHGSLHNSILTESLKFLYNLGVKVMPPRQDYGKNNIPHERDIVVEVCRLINNSPLKNIPILVTGGPTPVPIDNIRRLTNHFTGQLGVTIAKALYLKGADITLIHGESSYTPPDYLPYQIAKTYQDYLELVIKKLSKKNYIFGIFSAAVADYQPEEIMLGKIPSREKSKSIKLIPTIKVIEEVRQKFPDLYMVTFKYQEQVSHEALIELASSRIKQGYQVVVANRGEEMGSQQGHIAYLVTQNELPQKMIGKREIATKIVEHLEKICELI